MKSFESYGNGTPQGAPENFFGGWLKLLVDLTPAASRPPAPTPDRSSWRTRRRSASASRRPLGPHDAHVQLAPSCVGATGEPFRPAEASDNLTSSERMSTDG